MHRFFQRREEPSHVPPRVYARLIDGEEGDGYVLFDAVEAEAFDRFVRSVEEEPTPAAWRGAIGDAPIYAVQVNGLTQFRARDWLGRNPVADLPEWSEIFLSPDPMGEAEVYDNIAALPQLAAISIKRVSALRELQLKKATDLSPEIRTEQEIQGKLPSLPIEEVFALDVGQGAANALVTTGGNVAAYVDLGAGVLKDARTWPSAMGGICLQQSPVVILTHWHYDHFEAANIYPNAQGLTWIAPFQTLGPGPQSAMASAITGHPTGVLMVWSTTGGSVLSTGAIELELCNGPAGNQNRTGIAVWVHGPSGEEPILLPGDAGYSDILLLKNGRSIAAFAVAHHGGQSAGQPPARPAGPQARAAFSYGINNQYTHPLATPLNRLRNASWNIGHPGPPIDERRTEDRAANGLGHIKLDWSGGAIRTRSCSCGCTITPTQ
ncbi:hypothetical protein LMIY3S_03089 [Labrys miyagiensis]